MGFACTQVGNLQQAKTFYTRWLEIEPDRAQPFYSLGYVYYLEEDWREAIRWFEEALRLFPEYLVCLYRLGYAQYRFNKSQLARKSLEKAQQIYQANSDEDWLRRNRKNYIKIRFLLGKVYLELKQYRAALDQFQAVLQLDRKDLIQPEHKHYEMGKSFAALGHTEQALSHLQQALNPRFPQPYILDCMGRVYQKAGQLHLALEHYNRALGIRRLPFILLNRALLFKEMNQVPGAISDLQEALRRDKKGKHKVHLELARIYLEAQKLNEARHHLQAAIRFKQEVYGTDYAQAHYLFVFYYLKLNQKEQAQQALRRALELQPDLEWDRSLARILTPVSSGSSEDTSVF